MKTRKIGPFEVSAIGLGCMNLSHAYGTPPSPEAAEALLLGALDRGVTLFDTAALKISSSRISRAPSLSTKSWFMTGFDLRSSQIVWPLPVAMCRPVTKSGMAPYVRCDPWVLPEIAPATVWPLPIPAAWSARRWPSTRGRSSS